MPPLHALPLSLILLMGACASAKKEVDSKMDPRDMFVEGTIEAVEDGAARSYSYRLLKPIDVDEDQRPLLVFLHGMGERGSDNVKQLEYLPTWMCSPEWRERFDTFVLAVQCPGDEIWVGSWEGAGTCRAMSAVEGAIEHLIESENIDPSRVYLTGLSMGGFGSWDLASRHPDWFAAVVPICGGGDPSFASRIADSGVPIWTVHGDADRVVPVDLTRTMVGAIRKADGRVGYTELPGVRHDSWKFAYGPEGLMEWMLAQQLPATPVKTPPADASGG